MELLNIIIIFLIIIIVWLIVKFVVMRKQMSIELTTTVKNPPLTKKDKIAVHEIREGNIYFLIRIGNRKDFHKIVFKLFDDIVPLTCKNFRILSTKGINKKTYKNSIFHRVIKDFMIQGGDIINNDGTGSISIFGSQFEDENFKLSHNQPGLLSMANSGPNTNGSQFFITTAKCSHLDNKHVVFGKIIEGLEIIKKIEGLSTNGNDKPYENIEIIECGEI